MGVSVFKTCSIEECENIVTRRTWCHTHYSRWHRHGDPNFTKIEMHGSYGTKEYNIWRSMKDRCTNPNNKAYKDYGGRGIMICERWSKFENFIADMGNVPKRYYIDRIDNNGNYEPKNCKWITSKESGNNRRTTLKVFFNGRSQSLKQWCEELSLDYNVIWARVHKLHWDYDRALLTEVRKRG